MFFLKAMIESYFVLFATYPTLFIALLFVIGLLFGSFFNVVAIRIPKGMSIAFPPSHCTQCNHRLTARDLVPVFSYFFLKGKCRYCGTSVSLSYPTWELLTAVLFSIIAWQIGPTAELWPALIFSSVLLIAAQADLRYMIIPDKVVFSGIAALVVVRCFIHPLPFWHYALGFVVGGGVLAAIAYGSALLLRKEAMGGGDIKLFAFIGAAIGYKLTLLTLFAASLLGTLFGLILVAIGKFNRERYLPFGPFIAVGALFSYLWGDRLIKWYIGLLT